MAREDDRRDDDDDSTASYTSPSPQRERIGRYRVLEKVGEGGMGLVYLAEQEEPLRRRVALKVIKPGMDSAQVLARFEAERQALALMNHPNVARVFDAGTTADGRPFFVMEYVAGIPITRYCDDHQLDNRQRLVIFRQVCDAIQHAHQKGILHRDIKPSNILVALLDGIPQPKVIDFGIAKATLHHLSEHTVFTRHGVLIGTPEYMSPEQAEMGALDVDTRTDVYSLGVVLYELLCGELPLDPAELRAAGFDEIRRRIREDEPIRPSVRVSSPGAASADSARQRRTDAHALVRQLRGDLDWIAMRALEKDRARRYGSPSELSADIGRYLADEPVLARPPSAGYRLQKLVRRHRATFAGAALLFTALLAGLATTSMMLSRALKAEQAEAASRRAAEQRSYVANLRAAQISLNTHRLEEARSYLDACAPELRGWEWRHLARIAHAEAAVLEGENARFLPGGREILTRDREHWRLWDSSRLEPLPLPASLAGMDASSDDSVRVLEVSDEGSRALLQKSGSPNRSYRVVDLVQGRAVDLGSYGDVNSNGILLKPRWFFSGDSHYLACLGCDGSFGGVRVIDAGSGRTILRLASPRASKYSCAAFSPARDLLALSLEDGGVEIWDLASGSLRDTFGESGEGRGSTALAFSGDGTRLAIGGIRGNILLVLLDNRGEILPADAWQAHEDRVTSLAFSRDGERIVSASRDTTVRLWRWAGHVPDRQPTCTWLATSEVHDLRFSPSGELVAASGRTDSSLWDIRLGCPQASVVLDSPIASMACSPDGSRIACGLFSNSVVVLETRTSEVTARFSDRVPEGTSVGVDRTRRTVVFGDFRPVHALSFSSDGSRIVAAGEDELIRIHDATSAKVVDSIPRESGIIVSLDISPDGRWLAAGSRDGSLDLHDLSRAGHVRRLLASRGDSDGVLALSFSPDGRTLAFSEYLQAEGFRITLLDVKDEMPRRFFESPKMVSSLSFDPPGRQIAGGFVNDGVGPLGFVWDVESGRVVARLGLDGTDEDIDAVAFSPDGKRLAIGVGSRSVDVFDTTLFERILSFDHKNKIVGLSFSAEGNELVIGSLSGVTILRAVP